MLYYARMELFCLGVELNLVDILLNYAANLLLLPFCIAESICAPQALFARLYRSVGVVGRSGPICTIEHWDSGRFAAEVAVPVKN